MSDIRPAPTGPQRTVLGRSRHLEPRTTSELSLLSLLHAERAVLREGYAAWKARVSK
jgi:hypothetical protein